MVFMAQIGRMILMARPVQCNRCGRVLITTVAKNSRNCGLGKTRGVPAKCYGRMYDIPWDKYVEIMEEEK